MIVKNGHSIAHPSAEVLEARSLKNEEYLFFVLAKTEKGEYVTWLYNSQFQGFTSGHYFRDLTKALTDFWSRT